MGCALCKDERPRWDYRLFYQRQKNETGTGSHSKGRREGSMKTWKITINLSGENHVYHRTGKTDSIALHYARGAIMKECGISFARARGLNHEIEEIKQP
jgi:hypothetical protein